DRPSHLGLERGIIEHVSQRDESVEPVGDALPALGLTAEPGTIRDVRPELVEVTAQAAGLDPQLAGEPAGRPDAPQGEGLAGGWARPVPPGLGRRRERRTETQDPGQHNAPVTTRHGETLQGDDRPCSQSLARSTDSTVSGAVN